MRAFRIMVIMFMCFLVSAAIYSRDVGGSRLSGQDEGTITKYTVPVNEAALDSMLQEEIALQKITGLATVIINEGEVIWNKSYGLANVAAGTPVTDSTIFQQPAVSTVFTTTALMQLWEQGKLQLDEDINKYLPEGITVNNPKFPDTPITFRHILTGKSSIVSNWSFWYGYWSPSQADNTTPLATTVERYFDPEGSWYLSGQAFSKSYKPGQEYIWGNPAYTLLAYLVEVISGVEFRQYCEDNIFKPLQLKETTWRYADINPNQFALSYNASGTRRGFVGHPLWPTLMLLSSPRDITRFSMAMLNGGELDGQRILAASTVDLIENHAQIKTSEDVTMGLGWFKWHGISYFNGYKSHFMDGYMDFGINTGLDFSRKHKTSIICMANKSADYLPVIANLTYYSESYGEIFATDLHLQKSYIDKNNDSLLITSQLVNTNSKNVTAHALIDNGTGTFSDSVKLYDDGAHGDGESDDGVWGNYYGSGGLDEDMFNVGISTYDHSAEKRFYTHKMDQFTSAGPVKIESVTVGKFNGSIVPVEITLTNLGQRMILPAIKAVVSSEDTIVTGFITNYQNYGNLTPGERTTCKYNVRIAQSQSNNQDFEFNLHLKIYSDDVLYWEDQVSTIVGINEQNDELPQKFGLEQNYPNPFNPNTSIKFSLAQNEYVDLAVYNLLGERVANIVSRNMPAGTHTVNFDGSNLASGVYFYRLNAGKFLHVRKMVLFK